MWDPAARRDAAAAEIRVAVVGDLMLDRTRWVAPDAATPDEATPDQCEAHWHECVTEDHPGGAAHAARLLQSFGMPVDLFGVVGADAEGEVLRRSLQNAGCRLLVPTDASRPTTLKERLVTGTHERPRVLARIDHESTRPLPDDLEQCLQNAFRRVAAECRGLLISDYAKGVCSEALVTMLISQARSRGMVVIIDPARRTDCEPFAGCDVLTPNRREAACLSGIAVESLADAERAGRLICRRTRAACVVTLDADGALLVTPEGITRHVPAIAGPIVDTTGAGDAFAAALVMQLVQGRPITDAVHRAGEVAARQIARFGTSLPGERECGARRPHLRNRPAGKRRDMDEIAPLAALLRQAGRQIVLTNGCFDLLHPGHVGYLEQAAALGDCLIVALNADASVAGLKGSGRPIMSTDERARMLEALACVDYVVVFDEPTPHEVIRRVRPHVLVKGGDYALDDVVGREVVVEAGGEVRTLGLTPGLSTSTILRRMASSAACESLPGAG